MRGNVEVVARFPALLEVGLLDRDREIGMQQLRPVVTVIAGDAARVRVGITKARRVVIAEHANLEIGSQVDRPRIEGFGLVEVEADMTGIRLIESQELVFTGQTDSGQRRQ